MSERIVTDPIFGESMPVLPGDDDARFTRWVSGSDGCAMWFARSDMLDCYASRSRSPGGRTGLAAIVPLTVYANQLEAPE